MFHKPKSKSNSIASKLAKDKAKAKLVHKKKSLVKKSKPKPATAKSKSKSTKLTLEMIRQQNLKVGQCFNKSHHPDRSFQTKIHQGNGGVFFVFTVKGNAGAEVREFYLAGPDAGHTSYATTRHFPSVKEAHAAAAKLAKG